MSAVVGNDGLEGIPSLQDICDLFRSLINDTFNGGAGQINTDASPWMKPFLNSSIDDVSTELELVGDMFVVKDNYLLLGIPPITNADPTVQTSLTYQGYFDGVTINGQYRLPSDLQSVVKIWQRISGSNEPFTPVFEAPSGLPSVYQGASFTGYEVRGQNEIWFNGALQPVDLRIRYIGVFPNIVGDNIDFSTTYIPIQKSLNALAQKMVANYAQRLSPEEFPIADARADKFVRQLKSRSIRNNQNKEYQRIPFGLGVVGGAGVLP